MTSCATTQRHLAEIDVKPKPPFNELNESHGLWECPSIANGRDHNFLDDPTGTEEFSRAMREQLGMAINTPNVDPGMPRAAIHVPADDIDGSGLEPFYNQASSLNDWYQAARHEYYPGEFPTFNEFKRSMRFNPKVDHKRMWYQRIWEALEERGLLPIDVEQRYKAPIVIMDEFAEMLKMHLHEHGFGEENWLKNAMCREDSTFYADFMTYYLEHRFAKGWTPEGAFQFARTRVGLKTAISQ